MSLLRLRKALFQAERLQRELDASDRSRAGTRDSEVRQMMTWTVEEQIEWARSVHQISKRFEAGSLTPGQTAEMETLGVRHAELRADAERRWDDGERPGDDWS